MADKNAKRSHKKKLFITFLLATSFFAGVFLVPVFAQQSAVQAVKETVSMVVKNMKTLVFKEARQWQVASDAPSVPVIEDYTEVWDTTGNTTLTFQKPDGVQVDELLLIIAVNDDATTAFTDNKSGWNFIGNFGDTTSDSHVGLFWKIADGTEGSTETVTSAGSDEWGGWYVRISGVDINDPINVVGTQTTLAGSSVTASAVTTTVDGCLALCFGAFDGGDGSPLSVSGTGWSYEDDGLSGTSGNGDASGVWGKKAMTGTQGSTLNATISSNGESDGMVGAQIAIAPNTGPALNQNHYRWRDDTTALDTVGGYLATEDNSYVSAVSEEIYRLRTEIANTGAATSSGQYFQLEYSQKSGSDCDTSWVKVATSSITTQHWQATTSAKYANHASTTVSLLTGVGTRVDGYGVEYSSSVTGSSTIGDGWFAEFEYAIKMTDNAVVKQNYCFRLTNDGSTTNFTYDEYPEIVGGATISGTVYTNEGLTTSSAGSEVRLIADGVSIATTTASTTDGSYSFTVFNTQTVGAVLTMFLDDSSEKGVTVTRSNGSDITGLDIYKNYTIVRHEDSGPITIDDLDKYDFNNDSDILFTANATTDTLTASSSSEFLIWDGSTFSSGGVAGALSFDNVDINGTFTATSTQTITVTGSWDGIRGLFNPETSKVEFTSTTGGNTVNGNFYDLTFNGSGGGWLLDSSVDVGGDLTMTAGTATGTSNMTVHGGTANGDGTISFEDGTMLENIKQISAGSAHTCAVSNSGNTYCWGDDGDGELGNGAPTADQTVPDRVLKGDDTAAEDTDGINLINIKSISAGGNYSDMYTCAVSNSGNSYCWGYDYYGQLGNGDTVGDQTTPQRVEDGAAVSSEFDGVNLTNIKQIINGDNNSCVLSNIGNVYCWGSDSSGQLGDNQATTDRLTPIRVHDGAAVAEDTDGTYLINIKQITAGKWYVCALSNSGNTYCWGRDSYGQLGDNSTTTDRLTPIRVHDGAAVAADTDGTYLINMKEISAGEAHTCAISNSGNVYCWGDAYNGRLGDNQTGDDRLTPIRVHDGTDGNTQDADTDGEYLINMKSISAGYNYTCAISNASSTYCWGDVACGQLGDDQNGDDRLTPIRVHDGAAVAADTDGEYLINMKEISAGRYHTCAISNASSTYCWGDVGYGQLGDNSTTTDRHTPIRVHDGAATGADTDGTYLINMKSISAEYKYTCTVSNASSTYCWGESEHGRLGDNSTTTDRLTPVKVHDGAATGADTDGTYLINMQNISAGTLHACAISNSGNAYCWGDAYSGRLGDNQTATDRLTPVHTLRGMSNEDTSDIAKPFFTLNDTGTFGGDNPWSFTHLVFGNAHTTSTTTAAGTGLTTISRNLTIKENHILDAATKDWFLTGSGTPFVIDGTFTASTSHFKYTASSTTNIATTTYYNLSFLPTSGSPTYTIATGTIAITNDITIGDGTNAITLTANTTDATVDVGGVFTIATSSTYQASDTNDLTIAGNYTNSGTFTANSGTTTFDGTSQQTLGGAMTGANAFYTLKITNSSGSDPVTSPSVIFTSAASSTNFRAQTASTKIRFQESKGYSFVNFYLDGGATNTRVQLRSSIASTAWKLFVTGTQSVLNTNPQDSDASGGNEILANDGTSLDGTGNTHWDFGNATTTVVLNTADLEDFGTDTTPTLEFTGTDPDTDDVRYNIQIDTVDTFDNSDVDTYYFDASDDNPYDQQEVWTDDANVADGDTATTAYTSTLEDIGDNRLNFDGTNAPTTGLEITLVRARVYAYTETAGATDGVGFGISSGVETLVNWSAHDTTTTPAWSEYVVVSAPSGGWTWQKVNDLNTSLFKPDSGGNNTHVGRIEIEVTSVSLLDKLSGTDAGFANTASSTDTDPFTSAEKADYDVQPSDALASGTYYWRVRGLDPGGTNTYGDWSATQSFTIGGSDSLSFSISTSQSYFGTLVSGTPRFASSTAQGDPDEVVSHTLSASTTASSGYTITVRGDTLTSGVDTISAIGGTWASSSVDVEQFGLRITSSGGSGSVSSPYNGPDSYAYGATASVSSEIASTSGTSEDTTYSLYYITNAIANTDDGDYTATITYVITANF